ncbi:MAG: endonuclease MutS2 [Culicoidibacterales bacterium]
MNILQELEFNNVLIEIAKFAQTAEATELITSIIPSFEHDEVIKLQQRAEIGYMYQIKFGMPDFYRHHDIRPHIQYVQKEGILSEGDLFLIYEALSVQKDIQTYFSDAASTIEKSWYLLEDDGEMRLQLKRIFLDNGTIKDDATKNLQAIRLQIRNLETRIREVLMRLLRQNMSHFSEQYITVRGNRLVLPVRFEYKHTVKGITHDESQTGQTVYIEPQEVVNMNNDLMRLKSDERDEILLIRKMLSEQVSENGSALWRNYIHTLETEVMFAKASYHRKINGVLPTFGETYTILEGRHPLLNDNSVANDIILDATIRTLLLSGPNAGGKTVILKQIGLYTLMGQSGLALPVKEAEIPFYTQVMADIETAQSLSQNLSTFAAHVKRLSEIVHQTDDKTLVLLDEIGTGTDPNEGAALGIGVLQHLKDEGAFTVVSTHYSELKNYGYNEDGVLNATLEIESETLRPLYKLRLGHAGASHAYYIAKKFNMPEHIIFYLEEEYEKQKTTGILDLEQKLDALEKERRQVQEQLQQLDILQIEMQEEKIKVAAESNEVLERAKNEAQQMITKKMQEADQLLATLKEKQQSANFSNYAELKSKSRQLKQMPISHIEEKETTELHVGDRVQVVSLSTSGEVIAVEKDMYTVQMGMLKSTVARGDLKLLTKKQKQKQKKPQAMVKVKKTHQSSEVDYRGLRLHEVEERFVSDLMERRAHGYQEVRIIHGHGTGVIRNYIQRTLKKQTFVESYRFGMQSEGGVGATVVYFK